MRRAIDAIDAYEPWQDRTTYVSPELEAVEAKLLALAGSEWAGRYWQLVVLHLMARSLLGDHRFVLPPSMVQLWVSDLDRILERARTGAISNDLLGDDEFLEDLALSGGTVFPVDSCLAALTWLPAGFVAGAYGAGLWIQLHFRNIETIGFGPEVINWSTPYVIDFLEANPHCQGIYGITWLVDPHLEEVSPHLTWYRDAMIAAGAKITAMGTDQDTVSLALQASETRRDLYAAGKYQPRDYLMAFSRHDTLLWYENTAHVLPPPKRHDPRAVAAYAQVEAKG